MGKADEVLSFEQRCSQLSGKRCHPLKRGVAESANRFHTIEEPIDESIEHGITIADMPIDRRDRNAKIVGKPTHRERVDAVSLDDIAGDFKNFVGGDRSTIAVNRYTTYTRGCAHARVTAG